MSGFSNTSLWGQLFTKLGTVGWAPVVGQIIGAALTAYSLVRMFQHWAERGELKIAATTKAEDYVKSIWGTLEPNSPPEEESVSKKIEECKLQEAQEMLAFLARQMYENAGKDQFFKRWVDDWGFKTLEQIQKKLDAYWGYCAGSQEPEPLMCPSGFYLNGSVCTPLSPATLPPAIEPATGAYVPLPQATASSYGILGILGLALAAIVISR